MYSRHVYGCARSHTRPATVIDADPQANLTSGLGRKARQSRPTLYEVVIDQRPLEEILVATDLEHLTGTLVAATEVLPSGR